MGKIFLSYAEEDSIIALELVSRLEKAGHLVTYWENPKERGKRFVKWMKEKIPTDVFVVLMSSASMDTEGYCQREIDYAIQLEQAKKLRIYPVLVKSVEIEEAGLLASYDRFDLTGENKDEEIKALIDRLGGNEKSMSMTKSYQPEFKNREEELDEVFSNLTKPLGGVHFWQILAPPQMGKTWFLYRLIDDLVSCGEPWEIHRIDLRREEKSLALRSNVSVLLTNFFDFEIATPVTDDDIVKIARHVGSSKQFWLLVLDNADLLSDEVADNLHLALSQIDAQLRVHKQSRLAFIAATRKRFGDWLAISDESPRFKLRELSPFTYHVVYQTLDEMVVDNDVNYGQKWVAETAKQLRRITEGFPALLSIYLGWIKENAFIFDPEELEDQKLFTKLAKPYVEDTILSLDSLFHGESDANRIQPQYIALKEAISRLCLYRRFVTRYVGHLLQDNTNVNNILHKLSWEIDDLHKVLKRTYVFEPTSALDLWTVFYPEVRRLLFRYFYATSEQQVEAHQNAGEFYRDRWFEWDNTDRAIVLLEYLWHQTEYFRLIRVDRAEGDIKKIAKVLFNAGVKSEQAAPLEIAGMIRLRMLEDKEFRNTAYQISPELLDQLLKLLDKIVMGAKK